MIPNLMSIFFQMGWFNHQAVIVDILPTSTWLLLPLPPAIRTCRPEDSGGELSVEELLNLG